MAHRVFPFQHYVFLHSNSQIMLYGRPLSRGIPHEVACLKRSMLMRFILLRLEGRSSGRAALAASAKHRRVLNLLLAAFRIRSHRARIYEWSAPLATLIRAGIAHARRKETASQLCHGRDSFDAADMRLYGGGAAASRCVIKATIVNIWG